MTGVRSVSLKGWILIAAPLEGFRHQRKQFGGAGRAEPAYLERPTGEQACSPLTS
jgi:hypothetical protein